VTIDGEFQSNVWSRRGRESPFNWQRMTVATVSARRWGMGRCVKIHGCATMNDEKDGLCCFCAWGLLFIKQIFYVSLL